MVICSPSCYFNLYNFHLWTIKGDILKNTGNCVGDYWLSPYGQRKLLKITLSILTQYYGILTFCMVLWGAWYAFLKLKNCCPSKKWQSGLNERNRNIIFGCILSLKSLTHVVGYKRYQFTSMSIIDREHRSFIIQLWDAVVRVLWNKTSHETSYRRESLTSLAPKSLLPYKTHYTNTGSIKHPIHFNYTG